MNSGEILYFLEKQYATSSFSSNLPLFLMKILCVKLLGHWLKELFINGRYDLGSYLWSTKIISAIFFVRLSP